MINPDLTHYGLFLATIGTQQYEGQPPTVNPEVTVTLKSTVNGSKQAKVELLMSDMEIMNKVREMNDPAVKEAYEQMLTVMALTNGRVYTDDSGAKSKSK